MVDIDLADGAVEVRFAIAFAFEQFDHLGDVVVAPGFRAPRYTVVECPKGPVETPCTA